MNLVDGTSSAGVVPNATDPDGHTTNIEDALLAASVEGIERDDLRILSLLMTWLRVHHRWINADRLRRAVLADSQPRVRAFWAAAGAWLSGTLKDRRFSRLITAYRGPRLDLLGTGTEFHVARVGEDPRFSGGPLRVPANVLRDREGDVLPPAALASRHSAYRRRVLMGPTYRADMWAALDVEPDLPPAALARRAYGSFATAWQVKQDRQLMGAEHGSA
jgi:hypothetical protein